MSMSITVYYCVVFFLGQGGEGYSLQDNRLYSSRKLHPATKDLIPVPGTHRPLYVPSYQANPNQVLCCAHWCCHTGQSGCENIFLKLVQRIQVNIYMASVPIYL